EIAAPQRRLAVVADAGVRAPDLLAARQHLEPADAAVHVHAPVDVAAALEQRVGELDVEVAGGEGGDHPVVQVTGLVDGPLAALDLERQGHLDAAPAGHRAARADGEPELATAAGAHRRRLLGDGE